MKRGRPVRPLLGLCLCAALLAGGVPALAAEAEHPTLDVGAVTWLPQYELLPFPDAGDLFAARDEGGTGLVDACGQVVLPLQYDYLSFAPGGLISISKAGKYGAAGAQGQVVIPVEYADLTPIFHGLPMVAQKEPGGLWGALDETGNTVIPFVYDAITPFWEFNTGITLAVKDGQKGLLSQDGTFTPPAGDYQVVSTSAGGSRLVVKRGEAYAMVDPSGVPLVPFGTYPCIDKPGPTGAAVLAPGDRYVYGEPALMRWGAVDLSGNLVVPAEYAKVCPVDEGFLVIQNDLTCGLFSPAGEELIPCGAYGVSVMYHGGDYIPPLVSDLKAAAGWQEPQEERTPAWAEDYDLCSLYWSEGLSTVARRDETGVLRYGYVDEDGTLAVPCVFDEAWGFQSGGAIVTLDGVDGILHHPRTADAVSDWAAEEVARAREAGLVTPRTGRYMTGPITRLQFAELAANLVERQTGLPLEPAPEGRFTDTDDLWARKAAAAGIVNGVGDGSAFAPDQLITREQLAAMLYRTVDLLYEAEHGHPLIPEKADLSAYSDGDQVSDWAYQSMSALARFHIIQGSGDQLMPQSATSVEQAVLLVLRSAGL